MHEVVRRRKGCVGGCLKYTQGFRRDDIIVTLPNKDIPGMLISLSGTSSTRNKVAYQKRGMFEIIHGIGEGVI